jgi:hypothetical protein
MLNVPLRFAPKSLRSPLIAARLRLYHYYVADWNDPSLEVRFAGEVDEVKISVRGIEWKLKRMVAFLNGPYPGANKECEKCGYYEERCGIRPGLC